MLEFPSTTNPKFCGSKQSKPMKLHENTNFYILAEPLNSIQAQKLTWNIIKTISTLPFFSFFVHSKPFLAPEILHFLHLAPPASGSRASSARRYCSARCSATFACFCVSLSAASDGGSLGRTRDPRRGPSKLCQNWEPKKLRVIHICLHICIHVYILYIYIFFFK